jgi:uncharacterized protein DUF4384
MLRLWVGAYPFEGGCDRSVTPEVPMISLLAALSVLGTAGVDISPAPGTASAGAPVRLWMNRDRVYREGEAVRLQVDTDVDGYLLVLNYDTDGRVRVLFPLDPRDDAQVQAGRRYEARDEDGRQAFMAGGDGTGLIFAAISQEPWRFDEVVLNGKWDLTRLEIDRRSRNPEQDLTEVVQRIAGPKGFDYDVMGYRVYGERSYSTEVYPRGPVYVYDDGLYCNNWYWRYNGCRRWPYDGGWSFGASIFLGGYSPFYYDPFYYGSFYRPYGYGYGYGFGSGYYPYYPLSPFRPTRPRSVLVGRPRGYTIQPLVPTRSVVPVGAGSITAGSARGGGQGGAPPINWRARGPSDRRTPEVNARGPSRSPSSFEAPPARRARPENVSYPSPRGRGYGAIERESQSREAPPRAERSGGNYAPPPRAERGSGEARPVRGEPSHAAPPPRAESGGRGSGGGGGGRSSGGGGHGGGGGRSRRP